MKDICMDCFNANYDFYCCAEQGYLCIECVTDHKSHLVLNKSADLKSYPSTSNLLDYLNSLKSLEYEISTLTPNTSSTLLKKLSKFESQVNEMLQK